MTILYKLTDGDGRTHGGCQWGENVEHTAPGTGDLCRSGWLHAYTDPLLAVLLNPIHANFTSPRLWEADGDVGKTDHGLKVGCTRLRTMREIPLPEVTIEQRVKCGILCAKQVYREPEWVSWADNWLSGKDRSSAAAAAATAMAAEAEAMAAEAEAWAAEAAAWAAEAAAWAAEAAAWAAEAAAATAMAAEAAAATAMAAMAEEAAWANIDLIALVRKALQDGYDE